MKTIRTIAESEAERIPTPTKEQEIAILREAARQLGPLSYSGPWLAQQIDGIERDLRSDYFPQIDLESARRQCGEMLTAAHDAAAAKVEAAEKQAREIVRKAIADADGIRARLVAAMREAEKAILR